MITGVGLCAFVGLCIAGLWALSLGGLDYAAAGIVATAATVVVFVASLAIALTGRPSEPPS